MNTNKLKANADKRQKAVKCNSCPKCNKVLNIMKS